MVNTIPLKERKLELAALNPKQIQMASVIEVGKEAFKHHGGLPCVCNCIRFCNIYPCVACINYCFIWCDLDPYILKNIEILGDYAYKATYEISYELKESVEAKGQTLVENKSRMIVEMDPAIEKQVMAQKNAKTTFVKQETLAGGTTKYLVKPSAQVNRSE
jgi:hypothetical protein